MLFPTTAFVAFMTLVFIGAILVKPHVRAYKFYLFAASIIFYASWDTGFLWLLLLDIGINYVLINRIHRGQFKRRWLLAALAWNILYWGVFKYYNFFTDSLLSLLSTLGLPQDISVLRIIAPLGISFYTFRIVSHVVDSYKGEVAKLPSLIDFANFVAFFPQVISGPIAVAKDFYTDLNTREYQYDHNRVIMLFLLGLFKKYVLSSYLFTFISDAFAAPQNYSATDLILAAVGYTCLIYVDFSGYSDMSMALGNVLGFRVPLNFDMPYRSTSLKEFWRRWHISLGRWLKYYIYIPLGGNRNGPLRKYFNLFLTFTFAGFWHGAGWGFIIWGALHGIGLVINQLIDGVVARFTAPLQEKTRQQLLPVGLLVGWIVTFTFVVLGRIYFNTPDLATANAYFSGMLNPQVFVDKLLQWRFLIVMALVLLMNFVEIPALNRWLKFLEGRSRTFVVVITVVLAYIVLQLGPDKVAPFIYFRF